MAERKPDLLDIYTEYTKMREQGSSPDDAVVYLKPFTGHLGSGDLTKLGKMVQVWEARQGINFKPTTVSHPPAVSHQEPAPQPRRPIRRLEKQGPLLPPEPQMPIRRIATPTPDVDPDPGQRILCPNCNRPNKKGEVYCYACGEILQTGISRSSTKAFEDDDPEMRAGTSYYGQYSVLLIHVRGANNPLEGKIEGEAIIGRMASDSAMHPDIDLGPFDAENLGVSRLHATLKVQNNTLSIMDMDSKNHTFINGQRLHSHEVRVLHDGDEIRLARLTFKIAFKHQPRRIEKK